MNRFIGALVAIVITYYILVLGFAAISSLLRDRLRREVSTTEGQVTVLHFT